MKSSGLLFLVLTGGILVNTTSPAQAAVTATDQQSLHSQYVGKVLVFRKFGRMVGRYEVQEDGTIKGNEKQGFWSVDGAAQVKDIEFRKDRVTFKCTRLWADIQSDGKLHYFPATAALKGKTVNYPINTDIILRTSAESVSAADIAGRLTKLCLGEQDSMLSTAPAPIANYIQKVPIALDVNPAAGDSFKGTLPKVISNPIPPQSYEAELVVQTGQENFVVYVDETGGASVVGFTHILQYGLEETTIEAVKGWKFAPATQDGKPVAVRMAMSINYKAPATR